MIDWYFDFISPFAYLQSERLAVFEPYGEIRYRPVLFAGLLQHWEHKGPAELATKRRFTYRYVQWQAQQQGIAFKMPPQHPFNPLYLLRLALALDAQPQAVQQIFRFIWQQGRDPSSPTEIKYLLSTLGLETAPTFDHAIKTKLRQNTEQAIQQGVFGVPTLVINEELFWGFDATEMALDYLRAPETFNHPEMQRVSHLPIGQQRSQR